MIQEIFWTNLFFSFFFNLGDYLKIFFALALTGLLLLGIFKWFIRDLTP